MKPSKLFAAFVTMFALLATPAAFAQATQETEPADSSGVAARTQIDEASLMAALADVGGRVKDYNATKGKSAEDIQLVDVTTALGTDQQAYDEARIRYTRFTEYLQNVASKVSLLSTALAEANVENTDVVALDVLADGKIVIFYDTREAAAPPPPPDTTAAADSTSQAGGQ